MSETVLEQTEIYEAPLGRFFSAQIPVLGIDYPDHYNDLAVVTEPKRSIATRGTLMLTPIMPLEVTIISGLPIENGADQLSATIEKELKTYLPLKDKGYSELDSYAAVTKALAFSALKHSVAPMAYEQKNPVFPNGLYKMGEHYYRRDETGFYVVGLNYWKGREARGKPVVKNYLTLAPFKHPAHRTFAPDVAWAELAADVLSVL